jgi:uncharacterized membrane protein
MTNVIKVAIAAGFLLAPAAAHASLTVTPSLTVENRCHKDIIVAVHYKGSRGNWDTTSFVRIPARSPKQAVAYSNNSIFYYYAESTTGSGKTRWSGNRNTRVEGQIYPMKQVSLNFDRQRNRFYLGLNCKA